EPRELRHEARQRGKTLRHENGGAFVRLAAARDELHDRAIEAMRRAQQEIALGRDTEIVAAITQCELVLVALVQRLEPARQRVVKRLLRLRVVKRVEARREHEELGDPAREQVAQACKPAAVERVLGANDGLLSLL